MKNILVAPTAFKGTMSPYMVARAIADGLNANPEKNELSIKISPIADGGDGTIEALAADLNCQIRTLPVKGALGQPATAQWLDLPNGKAVVELASACGIADLSGQELSPLAAHTSGLGQVIDYCLQAGFRNIAIALGGSASTDGGSGALMALGARFLDGAGVVVKPGGQQLGAIESIDLSGLSPHAANCRFSVLTDVKNPLLGPEGAAQVFAPQKGASAEQVVSLEAGLAHFAGKLELTTRCGAAFKDLPGAGAAGGTAFGLAAVLKGDIVSGFDYMAGVIGLEARVAAADLVITGEGCFDEQSLGGKATGALAAICARHAKPVWIVAASARQMSARGAEIIVLAERNGQLVGVETIKSKMAAMSI